MWHRPPPRHLGRLLPLRSAPASLGLAFLVLFLCAGCASDPKRFPVTEVSPGIFEGYKPRTRADFQALKAHGVRTILSLQQLPWDTWPEARHARENGLQYRDVPILASPLAPNEQRVKQALLDLDDRSLRPIFVHCLLGKDRNTFLIGLYRIYFQDWTPDAAWAEMLRSGFHVRLTLRGFETYFWSHTRKPDWVIHPSVDPLCQSGINPYCQRRLDGGR
jgi:hypothetical protein